MVLNSLISLSVKLLILPSNLNEVFSGYSTSYCAFFSVIALCIFCHSLMTCRVSVERSVVSLMKIPFVLFVAFPLLLLIFDFCV